MLDGKATIQDFNTVMLCFIKELRKEYPEEWEWFSWLERGIFNDKQTKQ